MGCPGYREGGQGCLPHANHDSKKAAAHCVVEEKQVVTLLEACTTHHLRPGQRPRKGSRPCSPEASPGMLSHSAVPTFPTIPHCPQCPHAGSLSRAVALLRGAPAPRGRAGSVGKSALFPPSRSWNEAQPPSPCSSPNRPPSRVPTTKGAP